MFDFNDGLQIKFLHLGQFGCFVLSLCFIANDWLVKRGRKKELLTMIAEMVASGACAYDNKYRYYMRDPARALEAVTGTKWLQTVQQPEQTTKNYEVLYYEKPIGQTHFVVGDGVGNVVFDPSGVLKTGGWKLKHKREFKEVL